MRLRLFCFAFCLLYYVALIERIFIFFLDVGELDLMVNMHLYVPRLPFITLSFVRLFSSLASICFLLNRNHVSIELSGYVINVNCISHSLKASVSKRTCSCKLSIWPLLSQLLIKRYLCIRVVNLQDCSISTRRTGYIAGRKHGSG